MGSRQWVKTEKDLFPKVSREKQGTVSRVVSRERNIDFINHMHRVDGVCIKALWSGCIMKMFVVCQSRFTGYSCPVWSNTFGRFAAQSDENITDYAFHCLHYQ